MTLVLALDTSVDVRVGVARDGVVLARRHVADPRQHVEQLMPLVSEALTEAETAPGELDLVCVGLGPGPFTGLRVGIVAAQVLASVHRLPLHGVCSLDVIAAAVDRTGEFVVASDARRKELYWARYRRGGAGPFDRLGEPFDKLREPWDRIGEPFDRIGEPFDRLGEPFDKLREPFDKLRDRSAPVRIDGPHVSAPELLPDLPVLGPGVAAYRDRLGARPVPDGPSVLDAGLLAACGAELPSAGTEPLYLRRPDAAVATRRKSTLVRRVPRRRP